MPDYSELIAKQKQELQAQLARLEKVDIEALEAKKGKLQAEIEEIEAQIAAALSDLGIASPASGKAPRSKAEGIFVSFGRLKEIFQEQKTDELSLRHFRLNTGQIKKLVAEHPDALSLGGKGPWPVVKLKK